MDLVFGLALIGRISGELDESGNFLLILNKISALVMWGQQSIYCLLYLVNSTS